jgi:hypothetical protein
VAIVTTIATPCVLDLRRLAQPIDEASSGESF